jgi:hypothetical protein
MDVEYKAVEIEYSADYQLGLASLSGNVSIGEESRLSLKVLAQAESQFLADVVHSRYDYSNKIRVNYLVVS